MQWKEIDDFPGYSVSSTGSIRNDDSGRVLALQRNQRGVVNVGLVRDGLQHKRSVAVLVARAFLGDPEPPVFNTPIHLDGDTANNHVDNLMWRPRWFAMKYRRQVQRRRPSVDKQIQELSTGHRFNSSLHAAMTFGLLDDEIRSAMVNRTYVWPTYQRFRIVGE